jgi:hypothetical protein
MQIIMDVSHFLQKATETQTLRKQCAHKVYYEVQQNYKKNTLWKGTLAPSAVPSISLKY